MGEVTHVVFSLGFGGRLGPVHAEGGCLWAWSKFTALPCYSACISGFKLFFLLSLAFLSLWLEFVNHIIP